MTAPQPSPAAPCFSDAARRHFADHYPEQPHLLRHALEDDGRLTLDALAALAAQLAPVEGVTQAEVAAALDLLSKE